MKELQIESPPFPEVTYLKSGVTLEKIEKIEDESACKINMDKNIAIYYSVKSGLKLKEV